MFRYRYTGMCVQDSERYCPIHNCKSNRPSRPFEPRLREYKLDPTRDKKHLQKWSVHSIRVGACVILHGMGFTDTQIQFLLRWTSNAFYVYLRNIAGLAHKQNRALDDLSAMPNFI
jgi:hypothetical protein